MDTVDTYLSKPRDVKGHEGIRREWGRVAGPWKSRASLAATSTALLARWDHNFRSFSVAPSLLFHVQVHS